VTRHPSRAASSGAFRITGSTRTYQIARHTMFDGDESPAKSDDKSSHSKALVVRLLIIPRLY
jgi:hypothetical protein